MADFTIPRAFVSLDPWSGMLLVGMPRGVALPDGRDIGGYSLCKPATEGEQADWAALENVRVTLDDGSPVRLSHGTGGDIESVSVNAATLAHAVTFHLEEAWHPAGITYDGDSRDYDPTDVTNPMNLAGGMTAGGPTL